MRMISYAKRALAPLLGVVLVFFGLFLASPQIASIRASVGGEEVTSELPWIFYQVRSNNILTLETQTNWFSPRVWQIIPDDHLRSITVNGKPVSLEDIPPSDLRDYGKGFELDFSDHFATGTNLVEFRFDNGWGPGGIDIRPVKGWLPLTIIWLGFSLIIASLCVAFGLRRAIFLLLCFSLIPILAYWQETSWVTRTHDVGGDTGHYGYVKYVAEKNALPKPNEGWAYYHPPVYYMIGSVVFNLAESVKVLPTEALQALAIFFWLVFLTSSLAVLNLLLRGKPEAFWSAAIAIVLWPSGIMRSVALGNDVPLYACAGLVTWFMYLWWKRGDRTYLIWTSIFCALAILIKSNGIVLAGAVGFLLLVRFFFRSECKKCRTFIDGVLFGSVVVFGIAASFAVRIYYYMKGELSNWLVSNAGGLGDSLRVPVSIESFTPLDVPKFLTQPFLNSYEDSTGRANFWNFLMRSSLSGEFQFEGGLRNAISYGWGVALVLLFLASLVALPRLLHMRWQFVYRQMPLIVLIVMWLLGMILFRIQLPFACSNDFRYITPILVPLLAVWVVMGKSQQWLLYFISGASLLFFMF